MIILSFLSDIAAAQENTCPIKLTSEGILSNISDMKTSSARPFPAIEKQMTALGQRLREARLRRGISTLLFSERMNVSRDTLNRLEKGDPSIAMGTYVRALRVLGVEKDLDKVAQDDELGRKMQDLKMPVARKPRGSAERSKSSYTESGTENHGHKETD